MSFYIPNNSGTIYPSLAEVDKFDLDLLNRAAEGNGIVRGCAHGRATWIGPMVVYADHGIYMLNGHYRIITPGQSLTLTPHATLPRLAYIVAGLQGGPYIYYGVPSANPVAPTLDGQQIVVIAEIYIPGGATSIAESNIVDKRVFINPKAQFREDFLMYSTVMNSKPSADQKQAGLFVQTQGGTTSLSPGDALHPGALSISVPDVTGNYYKLSQMPSAFNGTSGNRVSYMKICVRSSSWSTTRMKFGFGSNVYDVAFDATNLGANGIWFETNPAGYVAIRLTSSQNGTLSTTSLGMVSTPVNNTWYTLEFSMIFSADQTSVAGARGATNGLYINSTTNAIPLATQRMGLGLIVAPYNGTAQLDVDLVEARYCEVPSDSRF